MIHAIFRQYLLFQIGDVHKRILNMFNESKVKFRWTIEKKIVANPKLLCMLKSNDIPYNSVQFKILLCIYIYFTIEANLLKVLTHNF